MAMDHARQFRPKAFAAIRNPEQFYQALGEEVEELIEATVAAMNPRNAVEYVQMSNAAESDLLREMILLPAEEAAE